MPRVRAIYVALGAAVALAPCSALGQKAGEQKETQDLRKNLRQELRQEAREARREALRASPKTRDPGADSRGASTIEKAKQ
jgi:hypothetical protein